MSKRSLFSYYSSGAGSNSTGIPNPETNVDAGTS
jgi:hypothetical protein